MISGTPPHKNQYGLGVNHIDALDSATPCLGVEAAADANIMKITEHCLFVRTAEGSIYGGRRGMSWWTTVITVFVFFFFSAGEYGGYLYDITHEDFKGTFLEHYTNNWGLTIGVTIAFFMACSWLFIPWRRQLPIIFNRQSGHVTAFINGNIVSEEWQHLEAYIKDITSFSVSGAAVNEGVLTLGLTDTATTSRCKRKYIGIYATQDSIRPAGSRKIYGAAQLWEYIRLYMGEGAAALPPSCAITPYRIAHAREAIQQFNPLKILNVSHPAWLLLAVPFFIFLALPLAPLIMIGDILYMWFDRILPRRKWPQELVNACDGIWDGKES